MPSRLPTAAGHLGWTAGYVGVLLAAASAVFAGGVPRQGCYPSCVGVLDPTLAVAGVAALVVGVVLAGTARLAGARE